MRRELQRFRAVILAAIAVAGTAGCQFLLPRMDLVDARGDADGTAEGDASDFDGAEPAPDAARDEEGAGDSIDEGEEEAAAGEDAAAPEEVVEAPDVVETIDGVETTDRVEAMEETAEEASEAVETVEEAEATLDAADTEDAPAAEDVLPEPNACGGSTTLPHAVGEDCGDCRVWQCSGPDTMSCNFTCTSGYYCPSGSDTCTLCQVDEHCGSTCALCVEPAPHCDVNHCVDCVSRAHCQAWEACVSNACGACSSSTQCNPDTCHVASGRCTTAPAYANGESMIGVLGQGSFTSCVSNRGSGVADNSLSQPVKVSGNGARMAVADLNNNRVLLWSSYPDVYGKAADLVLGQPNLFTVTYPSTAQNTLSIPNGVWTDGTSVVVADYANHRVLIWRTWPTAMNQNADVVLGHGTGADKWTRNASNDGGSVNASVLNQPAAVFYSATYQALLVVDKGNHRVLVYVHPLSAIVSGEAADYELGQADFSTGTVNAGVGSVNEYGFNAPSDAVLVRVGTNPRILVADTNNNRVLVFSHYNVNGDPATWVVGQTVMTANGAAAPPTASSLNKPHGVFSDGTTVAVADRDNNRVLIWNSVPAANGAAANAVIGQAGMTTSASGCSATAMNHPQGIYFDVLGLWVTQYDNHRVALFH